MAEKKVHTYCPSARSLVDVAQRMGLSRARVWQLEVRALKKLRAEIQRQAALEGKSVRDWLYG